jgi:hypothetical protein
VPATINKESGMRNVMRRIGIKIVSLPPVQKIGGFLAALLCGTALALAPATAASAHPTITELYCDSANNKYWCYLTYANAHEPVTITWYRNGSYVSMWNGQTFIMWGCTSGNIYDFNVYVTDIHGTATASSGTMCYG